MEAIRPTLLSCQKTYYQKHSKIVLRHVHIETTTELCVRQMCSARIERHNYISVRINYSLKLNIVFVSDVYYKTNHSTLIYVF